MEWIAQYGLFLAKILTIVAALAMVTMFIFNARQRKGVKVGELQLVDLSEQYQEMQRSLQLEHLDEIAQKAWLKAEKKREKEETKQKKLALKNGEAPVKEKNRLYVLNFKGSMDAHEVEALREEVTAVLAIARPNDEVLLKLESPGGLVHGYGLAASQLIRLRNKGIRLTVTVDKVAASGGYMMACVADRIVAAPFAILGSIGVVAQIPNIHRLLKKNEIDIELHTAGEFKRTLTMLGENTEQGRAKFQKEINETHHLFKEFVHQQRPGLDINSIATGEHWFGIQAKDKGLIDEIATSDEVLIVEMENYQVISLCYAIRKKLIQRFSGGVVESLDRLMLRWWQRGQKPLL